jgi:hypothetical protein
MSRCLGEYAVCVVKFNAMCWDQVLSFAVPEMSPFPNRSCSSSVRLLEKIYKCLPILNKAQKSQVDLLISPLERKKVYIGNQVIT